ncbi:hypothetical protein Cantr_04079 [Candida viswanathii]|uniref:HTH APSES-type domain-containing protein n=1 Tax=Candida viswanathii TaxID=5486 RepID=A0A367XQ04_9ASCO|nr:hypothetical protein Cantr_04079 [Candida viswanathii]
MIPSRSQPLSQTHPHQDIYTSPQHPPHPPPNQQTLPLLSIPEAFPKQLNQYNSPLPSINAVSPHQPVYPQFQRESASAANTKNPQTNSASVQVVSYSPISPEHTPPNVSAQQFYPSSSVSSSSYLAQPTTVDNNTQKMSYQFPVTVPMNYAHQFPPHQQMSAPLPPPPHSQPLTQQSPRQLVMKSNKIAKTHHQKKQKDSENMVSKFSCKLKSKKSKRSHTLIPNNSIYYPIHRAAATDGLSTYDTEYLNNIIYPKIEIKKYSTSALDPQRNYITAYEYPLNNLWVIWDYETGWVHLTGIWKASLNVEEANVSPSHMKADIVKLLESTPKEYQHYIKRIRGGFLKIQGTWLPYKLCKILARRFCYHIRFALVPIFGADFPQSCLKPNERGYGELKLDDLHSFEESALPMPIPPPPPQPFAIAGGSYHSESRPEQDNSSKYLPPVGALVPGQQSLQTSPLMQYSGSSFPFNSTVPANESNYNTPSTPPKRHYSSSSSISSISSSVFSGERITPISNEYLTSEIPSFNEMIDIVNASKCLQTLSKDSSSPRNMKQEKKAFGSRLVPENGGISAILLAAGLSGVSNNHREAVARSSPRDSSVKTGMTINDLLT